MKRLSLLLLLLLCGCGEPLRVVTYPVADYSPYMGEVAVYEKMPVGAETVGNITVEMSWDWRRKAVYEAFKKGAAEMGADAIVFVMPPNRDQLQRNFTARAVRLPR